MASYLGNSVQGRFASFVLPAMAMTTAGACAMCSANANAVQTSSHVAPWLGLYQQAYNDAVRQLAIEAYLRETTPSLN